MPHAKKPIIEDDDGKRYLKLYAQSGFGALLHSRKDEAVQQADDEAERYHEMRYVIKVDEGYISVNVGGYLALFGDVPGDDVVYRAQPW
jgi:hypothetical protein